MELDLTLENPEKRVQLFGPADANLRLVRETCNVHITARDENVRLTGSKESVTKAEKLLRLMQGRLKTTDHLGKEDMKELIVRAASELSAQSRYQINVYARGCQITARTEGQQNYIKAIQDHDLVFCTGPAGTGKTYLAVACAVAMLKQQQIRRIVLARPAVEAGEKLGFLPGDLQEKVNPYLRPLFDALGDMMEYAQIKKFITNDIIEIIPLAFMRGRTLNDALVILDEAQNTTAAQMLMFLTRMGNDTKMVVTGDGSQSDLPDGQLAGLADATMRLKGVKGIEFVKLEDADIVRHRLVQNIVRAYDKNGNGDNG